MKIPSIEMKNSVTRSGLKKSEDVMPPKLREECCPSPICSVYSVMREGGSWLAAVRTWIQSNAINGESVDWGSNDVVKADFTVRNLEELAAAVVAADRNEQNRKNAK